METLLNWRHFWCVLVLVSSARAQEAPGRAPTIPPACSPADPTRCAQPLEKGQIAPYAGQLLSPNLAIDLGQKATFCDERLKLELDHAKAVCDIGTQLASSLLLQEREMTKTRANLLIEQLSFARQPNPWYERPIFVAIFSVVGTALATYGMFELATRIK